MKKKEDVNLYQRLIYRRQFLLTKGSITSLSNWQYFMIEEYHLYVHPDLEVNQIESPQQKMVLIGSIFDPAEPEMGNSSILNIVHANTDNIDRLFLRIKQYTGCYALIYLNGREFIILHDALGVREIYYCINDNLVVCGSQPNLIANFANPVVLPKNDNSFIEYHTKHLKNSRWNPAYKWIGDGTYYEGVNHLLPNHYLDIKRHEVRRYWPNEPIKRLALDEAVARICAFLKGTIRAIAHRHQIMMAVTSGTDSRTLLAASRDLHDKIYYFINNEGLGHDHPDISVPKEIFRSLGIPFHVHEVQKDVDDEFRRIFLDNTFFASDRILPTIYNIYFKNLSEKVNLLGLGEIGRTRFGKQPKNLNGYKMAYKLGYRYKDGGYVIEKGDKILAELLPVARTYDVNVLTLFYWEHFLGNWGTTGNSESDIAIEELNPYDCHMLYEMFLGVDERYTKYYNPKLFIEIIRNMWPELLEWAINPPHTTRGKAAKVLKKLGIFEALKEWKYMANYFTYLCKTRL